MSTETNPGLEALTTATTDIAARIQEAQGILTTAATGGYFESFATERNSRVTHKRLRESALELLAGQYPDLDVRVVTYPGSEEVDLRVIRKKAG